MDSIVITVTPVTIAGLVALAVAVASGLVWIGKLSSRINRLETDCKNTMKGQQAIRSRLDEHIGYHQGLSAHVAAPTQPQVASPLAAQNLGQP